MGKLLFLIPAVFFLFSATPAQQEIVDLVRGCNLQAIDASVTPLSGTANGKHLFSLGQRDGESHSDVVKAHAIQVMREAKAVIPLKALGHRSLVTVKLGDAVIPDIMLDTGFDSDGLLIYNPDLRNSLDLSHARKAEISGAGSGSAPKAMVIEGADLSVGSVHMKNQRIIVLQSDIYKGFPTNGVIGYSIFGHYVTEIDYDTGTMILHERSPVAVGGGWTGIPMYFRGNQIPWIDASVAVGEETPVSISMYIDFAAGDPIVLLERPQMKFRLPNETTDFVLGRGLQGDIHGKKGTIAKLIIGSNTLGNVIASFASAEVRSKQENADGILGSGSLRRFNLIFDYAGKMLCLKPNSHFNDPYQ